MRIDISLLPALAAAFILVFARIGAMVMLLPGFGETNIPVRVRLAIALALKVGARILYARVRAKRRAEILIGVHATLAVFGFVLLIAYVFS